MSRYYRLSEVEQRLVKTLAAHERHLDESADEHLRSFGEEVLGDLGDSQVVFGEAAVEEAEIQRLRWRRENPNV